LGRGNPFFSPFFPNKASGRVLPLFFFLRGLLPRPFFSTPFRLFLFFLHATKDLPLPDAQKLCRERQAPLGLFPSFSDSTRLFFSQGQNLLTALFPLRSPGNCRPFIRVLPLPIGISVPRFLLPFGVEVFTPWNR